MTMSNGTLRISLSALATTAALVLAGPAHAAVWNSDYDPPAFIGTAVFDVPTPCLSGVADGEYLPTDFPGCSPIRVISNVSTTPAIDFSSVLPSSAITSYDVIGGQFVGVDTGIIGSAALGFWFQFLSNFQQIGDFPPTVTNTVNLYNNCSFDGPTLFCGPPVNVATIVSFARAPEPGSLGLILGALGAGWLARRRKIAA
jgi:hypothetical protein